jgi:hypothetical protein
MKYYCKNCGSIFEPGNSSVSVLFSEDAYKCFCSYRMQPIPDHETPEQYKKRTGKAFPNNGAVWCRRYFPHNNNGKSEWGKWVILALEQIIGDWRHDKKQYHVVIADPPVPPPENWKPE